MVHDNRLHENPFQMKTYCKMVREGITNGGVYIYKRIETCVCVSKKEKDNTEKKKSRHMMHDEKAKKKKTHVKNGLCLNYCSPASLANTAKQR